MADEPRLLGFGVTFHMVAAETACGQVLTLTSHRPHEEIPPHRHANDYLCIVLSGGFAEIQSESRVDRAAGTIFAHHSGETHHDRFGARGAMCVNLHFAAGERRIEGIEGRCSAPIKIAAHRLAFELAGRRGEELVMASLAGEIMGQLGLVKFAARDSGDWLQKVVDAIADEPVRRWSLIELAAIAERHPVHLAQTFRAKFGMSLGAFQRLRRLAILSLALRDGCMPLARLAGEFGYCDQSHMAGEFRSVFGVSPGRYRREVH